MKSFIKTGQGNLRTYLTLSLLVSFFALFNIQSANAQVDVNIVIIESAAASGGGGISVNPNPVSSLANVEHDPELSLQTLTILTSDGGLLAVLSLGETTSFDVQLPAGLTNWVFQTSSGVISRQVLIVEL